jgi:hypothetical protein
MTDSATRKLFGAQPLTGAAPVVYALLQGLTQYNWEAAWPGIQKALTGLSIATIAAVKGEAIARGLVGLAERISAFEPTASPMPGAPLTPQVSMPYIPLSPTMRAKTMEEAQDDLYTDYLSRKLEQIWERLGNAKTDEERKRLEEEAWDTEHRIATAGSSDYSDRSMMVPYIPLSLTMDARWNPSVAGEANELEDYYRRLLERLATETDPTKRKAIEEELDKAHTQRMGRAREAVAQLSQTVGWHSVVAPLGQLIDDMESFTPPQPPHDPCKYIRQMEKQFHIIIKRAAKIPGTSHAWMDLLWYVTSGLRDLMDKYCKNPYPREEDTDSGYRPIRGFDDTEPPF